MAKLTAVLITVIGLIYSLAALNIYAVPRGDLIVALSFLVIGIGKLVRNYKK